MDNRTDRFLAFVDYLGTRELYQRSNENAERIEDRRYELEHGIHFNLQRAVAAKSIEIGVFSDTVLIAGGDLQDVLSASATLLNFVLKKTLIRADAADVRLLRGGISYGIQLRSNYLRPAPGISVIPFFDGSLAFAYELEELRRGSRLYLDSAIAPDRLGELAKYTFEWKQMTGFGKPTADVREFLWPAMLYADEPDKLAELLDSSMKLWRIFLGMSPVSPDIYRATLYHFDETIKVIIRSFVTFPAQARTEEVVAHLLSHLPRADDRMEVKWTPYVGPLGPVY